MLLAGAPLLLWQDAVSAVVIGSYHWCQRCMVSCHHHCIVSCSRPLFAQRHVCPSCVACGGLWWLSYGRQEYATMADTWLAVADCELEQINCSSPSATSDHMLGSDVAVECRFFLCFFLSPTLPHPIFPLCSAPLLSVPSPSKVSDHRHHTSLIIKKTHTTTLGSSFPPALLCLTDYPPVDSRARASTLHHHPTHWQWCAVSPLLSCEHQLPRY